MKYDVFGEIEHIETPKNYVLCTNSETPERYRNKPSYIIGKVAYWRNGEILKGFVPIFRKMTVSETIEYKKINCLTSSQ